MNLQSPLRSAGFVFRMRAKQLEKLGLKTIEDLIYYVPYRYEDFSLVSKIDIAQGGEKVTIRGKVISTKSIYTKSRFNLQKIIVSDETGEIECTWFNQKFILRTIKKGNFVSISGKVDNTNKVKNLIVEEYEILQNENDETFHTGRLIPIYPETRGLSSKWIRNRLKEILKNLNGEIYEFLPKSIISENNLLDLTFAIKQIHFPSSVKLAEDALKRLSFDELFLTQLASEIRKKDWQTKKNGYPFEIEKYKSDIENFWENLSFTLTSAQLRSIHEILSDLEKNTPMNRMLQGDVGSGKTVVAAISIYIAHLNGFQSVFMAPTEILAQQHYNTLKNLLSPLGIKVDLITGKKKTVKKNELRIKNKDKPSHDSSFMLHDSNVVVGTHALLQKGVLFKNLGLVVIDEQQRFGVEHRAILRDKGKNPHFLTMTATPIPRTVFLTLYGDLKLSLLDEMPIGRRIIKTWLVPEEKRESGYRWIEKQIISERTQVFIVCPFIEESESMATVKAATKEFENLSKNVFPNLKLGLLHGKMKTKEKDEVLGKFKDGEINILVATPVVEVGIDIPNATIMIVEASERFGLAQLHQLRGRVGRSDKQSYCLLFTDSKSPQTIERLKYLERSHVGAELAELDLKLRGPGDMFGTLQHGKNALRIASFSDFPLIASSRKAVEAIFPELNKYNPLLKKLESTIIQKVTPD